MASGGNQHQTSHSTSRPSGAAARPAEIVSPESEVWGLRAEHLLSDQPEARQPICAQHAWADIAASCWSRFLTFVTVPDDPDACWLWGGAKSRGSGHLPWYGSFRVGHWVVRAHIFVCVALGRNPLGKHVDHTCLNTLCVNPHHLEVVTQAVNTERRIAADRARKSMRLAA